jgi:hypothetical protein
LYWSLNCPVPKPTVVALLADQKGKGYSSDGNVGSRLYFMCKCRLRVMVAE